ncbi:hypothetical protein ACQ33O_08945 [Ferruginibacter sp. SUN002]|uniref:hypothetical protein n=1 Tax=Ferruginibacter sp. SUN002 TaxID=2937789 RepID=UPI003D36EFCB
MYLVKTLCLALFTALFFTSCEKGVAVSTDDLVQVKFINATGKSIANGTIEGNYIIGYLEDGAETGYINFKSFGTDTGMPDMPFTAEVGGSYRESNSKFYFCGTEKSKLLPGKYTIVISTVELPIGEYMNLQFKH